MLSNDVRDEDPQKKTCVQWIEFVGKPRMEGCWNTSPTSISWQYKILAEVMSSWWRLGLVVHWNVIDLHTNVHEDSIVNWICWEASDGGLNYQQLWKHVTNKQYFALTVSSRVASTWWWLGLLVHWHSTAFIASSAVPFLISWFAWFHEEWIHVSTQRKERKLVSIFTVNHSSWLLFTIIDLMMNYFVLMLKGEPVEQSHSCITRVDDSC